MKRTLVGIMLAGLYATASAQGYVGAIVGLSNYDLDCKGISPCDTDKKGTAFKFYAGTQFKQGLLDTERFKIDTLEVSYLRFGKANQGTGVRTDLGAGGVDEDTGENIDLQRPLSASTRASALTVAGVARFLVTPKVTGLAKAGVAYVQTTVDQRVNGGSWGSDTKSKFKPYLGLGVEFAVNNNVKLVGSFDYTQYEGHLDGNIDGRADNAADNVVSDTKIDGSLYQLGLGVQLSF